MQLALMNHYRGWYILRDKTPVPVYDVMEWATMFERDKRKVAFTKLSGSIHVSTVFLGLDHGWSDGPPLLFETMIFGGKHDQYQDRYETWEQAEAGHLLAVGLADADRWNWFVSAFYLVKRRWERTWLWRYKRQEKLIKKWNSFLHRGRNLIWPR